MLCVTAFILVYPGLPRWGVHDDWRRQGDSWGKLPTTCHLPASSLGDKTWIFPGLENLQPCLAVRLPSLRLQHPQPRSLSWSEVSKHAFWESLVSYFTLSGSWWLAWPPGRWSSSTLTSTSGTTSSSRDTRPGTVVDTWMIDSVQL